MPGPLAGVHVLEVCGYITGPFAGQMLADYGAEVIKIEPPGEGDPFRGPDLYRPAYIAQNRSKRSLTLNLKSERGREVFYKLMPQTDVVTQNMRPGVAERLGIGYEQLRELRPDLIYCSISGFGATGPYAHRPSYNEIGSGLSGLLSQLVDVKHPKPIGPGLSDTITGIYAAQGVLAALYARATTGQGQHVEVSQLEATLGLMTGPFAQFFADGRIESAYD
ncbi:MAG TPA: CaiB/BaiF CoA-transferase family protein, partial [Chloroflexota bacterium]|nr:CaiB/BaiF CoA-transferase family protein [Chloroflexota bacterium]